MPKSCECPRRSFPNSELIPPAAKDHVEERDAINSSARAATTPNECNEDREDRSGYDLDFCHLLDAGGDLSVVV